MVMSRGLIEELNQREMQDGPDELRSSALRPLRHALALSLLYSHDIGPGDSAHEKHFRTLAQAEPAIFDAIGAAFDEHLYVHRRIVDEIAGLAQQRRLLILTGHAGTGKSTILRRVAAILPRSDECSITYINLKDAFSRLASSGNPGSTVCGIVHDALMEGPLMNRSEWKRRLRASYVLDDPHFDRLKQQIISDPDVTVPEKGDLLDAVVAALEQPSYRRAHKRLLTNWFERTAEHNATARLQAVLSLLARQGHHPIVILDNIDRYSLKLQREVIDKAMDFAGTAPPLLTPIVAVRTGNFRRLVVESQADYIFFVHKLRDFSPKRLVADHETVREFIRRRVTFALSIVPPSLVASDDLARLATQLGYLSAGELLEAHLEALRRLTQDVSHVDIIRAFTEWHNESLRGLAAQLFNLVHSMLIGRDPLFLFAGLSLQGTRNSQTRGVDERRLRTMLYRHMVLSNRRPSEALMVLDIFRAREYATEATVVLPHDKLLWLLLNADDHEMSYGDLIAALAAFGVGKESCFSVLQDLWRPRPYDASGFVHIDRAEEKVNVGMNESTRIQLLPAGRFFLRELSVSCEYLFWMAVHSETFEPPRTVTLKGVESDVFRAFVASRFLRDVVLAQTMAEFESQRGFDRARELCTMFGYGNPRWGFLAERAARSVSVFVRETRARLALPVADVADPVQGVPELRRKREDYLNAAAADLQHVSDACRVFRNQACSDGATGRT